jgi:hypothetical protein
MNLRCLKENKDGIIGVWSMAIAIVLVGSMLWSVIILCLSVFTDNMLASPFAPINLHGISNSILQNAAIVEVIIILGPLLWAFAMSFRRETQEY